MRWKAVLLFAIVCTSLRAAQPRPGWLGFSYTYHGTAQGPAIQWLHVRALEPGGPAEKGGLKAMDVVTAFDGKPVAFANAVAMLDAFAAIRPGQAVRLAIVRGGTKQVLTVRAAAMTDAQYDRWKINYELARKYQGRVPPPR